MSASLGRLELTDEADLEQGLAASDAVSGAAVTPSTVSGEPRLDYFTQRGDVAFAGVHVIVDLWGASGLDSLTGVEAALRGAAEAAGATVLGADFHHFQPNGGVSGVLVLAESHISIHTWPEASFAAVDAFMCGACDPMRTVPILRAAFAPDRLTVQELRRGVARVRR